MKLRSAVSIAFASLLLAGCGNKGPLVQAPPKPAEEAPSEEQTAPPAQETPADATAEPEAAPPAAETPPPADPDAGG